MTETKTRLIEVVPGVGSSDSPYNFVRRMVERDTPGARVVEVLLTQGKGAHGHRVYAVSYLTQEEQ